jgi:hypothetical protein
MIVEGQEEPYGEVRRMQCPRWTELSLILAFADHAINEMIRKCGLKVCRSVEAAAGFCKLLLIDATSWLARGRQQIPFQLFMLRRRRVASSAYTQETYSTSFHACCTSSVIADYSTLQ